MERVLNEIEIHGVLYKLGDIVRPREIPENKGKDFYGKYRIIEIIHSYGEHYFDLKSLEDGHYLEGRCHWRFELNKNTNRGAY